MTFVTTKCKPRNDLDDLTGYMKEGRKKLMKKCLHTTSQIGWKHTQTDGPEKPLSGIRGLSYRQKTQRRARRPAKRWEDDLNDLVKDEETHSDDLTNKNACLITSNNIYEWEKKERQYEVCRMAGQTAPLTSSQRVKI